MDLKHSPLVQADLADLETRLDKMIFVFGSNEAGRHGAGAAKFAYHNKGAVYGIAWGLRGQSFALPTMDKHINPLRLDKIRGYVTAFLDFAIEHPDLTFQVTCVGCGLGGRTHREIAPMFKGAPGNCWFDDAWRPYMESEESCQRNDGVFDYKYWGTF